MKKFIFKGSGKSGNAEKGSIAAHDVDGEQVVSSSQNSPKKSAKNGSNENDWTLIEDEDISYKEGCYQLHIHLIECSELVSSGSINPVVFLEVLDKKIHTKQKGKCTSSCIFDETFYIQLDDMNESKIQDGNIAINMVDSSTKISALLGRKPFGTFSTDLETVYHSPNHELYHLWVPLLDPVST